MPDQVKVDGASAIPAKVYRGPRKYPFDTMKVGESFVVPCSASNATHMYRSARAVGAEAVVRREGNNLRVYRSK